MQAFGPFADKIELDFSELGAQTYFLIHGQTGAGKTTVLDGICFALYGESSGRDRDPRRMRSQQAAPDIKTEVVFDFSLGERKYRIRRAPEQEMPKKRGEGSRKNSQWAAIWDRTGLSDDDPNGVADDGVVLADKVGSVNEKVVSLLGFHCDQFRQVIILPQGKFRDLLVAGSEERRQILETLFEAEKFRFIQEELKRRTREKEAEIKAVRTKIDLVLNMADAETAAELKERFEAQCLEKVGLEKTIVELRQVKARTSGELERAKRDVEKIQARDSADKKVRDLEYRKPEILKLRQDLEKGILAVGLKPVSEILEKRKAESVAAAKDFKAAEKMLLNMEEERKQAEERLKKELTRDLEVNELKSERTLLKGLAPKVGELEKAGLEHIEAEKESSDRAAILAGLVEKLKNIQSEKADLEKRMIEAASGSGRIEALNLEMRELEKIIVGRGRVDELHKIESQLKKRLQDNTEKVNRLEIELKKLKASLNKLEKSWRDGQAAVLARTLKPGSPCPVCGSVDHPEPACSIGDIPSDETLDALKIKIESLEKDLRSARNMEAGVGRDLAALRAELETVVSNLGENATEDIGSISIKFEKCRRDLAGAEKAKASIERLEKRLTMIVKEEAENLEKREQAERKQAEAISKAMEASAAYKALESQIPMEYRESGRLKRSIDDAARRIEDLERSRKKAEAAFAEAEKAMAGARAGLEAAKNRIIEAEEQFKVQEMAFLKAMGEAGFEDMSAYERAGMPDERIKELDALIRDFEVEFEAAKQALEKANREAVKITMPDMDDLEEKDRNARVAVEKAVSRQAALEGRLAQMEKWLDGLEADYRRTEDLEKHYGLVGRLSDTASGSNPLNLSFQRFVLGALLDDVLIAATDRLMIMSGGRYQLQRKQTGDHKGKAWGLDLQVFDEYTGLSRPATTLSGGESFLASLSLALGLADVVQSYAGGIHLDTIFVDEGFGSLDPESLDLALRALEDLQKGGRLVGLISHVPEMKERIGARLEVSSLRTGSTARFVVN